uniref:Uncharacterized protein n=1 Tax=Arundo donax TaxID=35708 RepID=A0A0A9CMA4_ARUDO
MTSSLQLEVDSILDKEAFKKVLKFNITMSHTWNDMLLKR